MKGLLWFLLVLAALLPAITYLVYYYRRLGTRRTQLLQTLLSLSLDDEYMLMRHGQKYSEWKGSDEGKRLQDFEALYFNEDFKAGYSHQDYAWPVLLMVVLSAVGWLLTLERAYPGFSGLAGAGEAIPAGLAYGFVGAYLACLSSIFDGFRRYDLDPGLYYSLSFRIVFASFAAFLVSLAFRDTFTPLVAVGVGMFPLQKTWAFLTERAGSALGNLQREEPLGAELAVIQGLEHHSNRQKLLDVGISTVQQLATADPLLLFFHTTFPLRTVVDMIDKALLYLYVGDRVAALRSRGINGVIELVALVKLADNAPAFRLASPGQTIERIQLFNTIDVDQLIANLADVFGQTPDELKAFIYNLYWDPMVNLNYEIWGRYLNRPVERRFVAGAAA